MVQIVLRTRDNDGLSPIMHLFGVRDNKSIFKLLIKKNINLNLKCKSIYGTTLLEMACLYNNSFYIKILLENGAQVHEDNYQENYMILPSSWKYRQTCIDTLCRYGRIKGLLLLLECHEYHQDSLINALYFAKKHRSLECPTILLYYIIWSFWKSYNDQYNNYIESECILNTERTC